MKHLLFLIFLISSNIALAYETASYQVIQTISDKIEIRKYQKPLLASISSKISSDQNDNFRVLFKFISGANKQNQKIDMTTPVFQEYDNSSQTMSFVMPNIFNKNTVPEPNNTNIRIDILKGSKFVAIRFSGRSSNNNFVKKQKVLEQIIKENNLKADLNNPIRAYYNHPWTLPFLKRSEVLFRLK